MAKSRAMNVSEKRTHKRSPRRSEQIFPSALLGDAEIPYSLSREWRAINETCLYEFVLLRGTSPRFSFFRYEGEKRKEMKYV